MEGPKRSGCGMLGYKTSTIQSRDVSLKIRIDEGMTCISSTVPIFFTIYVHRGKGLPKKPVVINFGTKPEQFRMLFPTKFELRI